ncbi:hypothetical protein LC040_00150 [Bacillus tianshenii]|nr:hypothetical protein LC040_00150 [Bacillus tianshenii]
MKNAQRLQLKYLDKANGKMVWHLPEKGDHAFTAAAKEPLASFLPPEQRKQDIRKIQQALELLKEIMDDDDFDDERS